MIKLPNISKLTNDMITKKIFRQKYKISYNKKTIEIMYFVDTNPYKMIVGIYGTSFGFVVEVSDDVTVENWIDTPIYQELCRLLEIEYNPTDPFSPTKFFNMIDNNSPIYASVKAQPTKKDTFTYVKRYVEESDKIYFCGWLDNSTRENHFVTDSNLLKTEFAFGSEAATICKEKNISSKWTDIKSNELDYFSPKKK